MCRQSLKCSQKALLLKLSIIRSAVNALLVHIQTCVVRKHTAHIQDTKAEHTQRHMLKDRSQRQTLRLSCAIVWETYFQARYVTA